MTRLTTLLAAGALLVLTSREAAAQAVYTVTPPAVGTVPTRTGYTPITFTGGPSAVASDSGGAVITLPTGFTFPFYGQSYSTFTVTADGLILFNNDSYNMYPSAPAGQKGCGWVHTDLCGNTNASRLLPDSANPNNLIGFWWGDMLFVPGSVVAQWTVSGTAPNRVFTLHYASWYAFDAYAIVPAPQNKSSREIWVELHETSGAIEIYFGAITNTGDPGMGASVGIEGLNVNGVVDGVAGLPCTNIVTGSASTSRCRTADFAAVSGKFIRFERSTAPDLAVISVVPSAVTTSTVGGVPGYTVDLSTTVANRGPASAVGFKYDVYVSTDATIDPATDTRILAHATPETLANGQRIFVDTGITFAKPQNATRLYFGVVVDPTNAVVEAVETNNTGVSGPVLTSPDLQGQVYGPAKAGPNQPMTTRVVVRNVGADSAGPFTYELYLSSNQLLDSADTRIYSATLTLGGMATYDNNAIAVNIPSNVVPASYYLLLVIDPPSAGKPSGDVVEVSEANNTAYSTSTVQIIVCRALDVCHLPGVVDAVTGTCTNPVRVDGATCFDGDLCTKTDVCQGGVCVGSNPVTCAAADQCHSAGTCDPFAGTCSNPVKPDGSACDDANACTTSDACLAGACVGIPSAICTAKDQCHVAGVCDPSTGACSEPTKDDGAGCDDGDACTQADVCQAGACVGFSRLTCRAIDTCHDEGVCDPLTGACSTPEKPDGSDCSDGNACTQRDACVAGVCVGGEGARCDASGPCRQPGTCDPETGSCRSAAKPEGTSCDDGNPCTLNDACRGGACVGAATFLVAPDECHVSGTCDPQSGETLPMPDGTTCSAGACAAGKCVAVTTPEPQPAKGAAAPETSGCGCGASGSASSPILGMALLALAGMRRRRGR